MPFRVCFWLAGTALPLTSHTYCLQDPWSQKQRAIQSLRKQSLNEFYVGTMKKPMTALLLWEPPSADTQAALHFLDDPYSHLNLWWLTSCKWNSLVSWRGAWTHWHWASVSPKLGPEMCLNCLPLSSWAPGTCSQKLPSRSSAFESTFASLHSLEYLCINL